MLSRFLAVMVKKSKQYAKKYTISLWLLLTKCHSSRNWVTIWLQYMNTEATQEKHSSTIFLNISGIGRNESDEVCHKKHPLTIGEFISSQIVKVTKRFCRNR